MSSNITISEGLQEAWEIPGSDFEKPDEIILPNLAVAQLAFIGSSFGGYLNKQSIVIAELAGAVEKVRQKSAEVSAAAQNWLPTENILNLSLPPSEFKFGAQQTNLVNPSSGNYIDKLILANKTIKDLNLNNPSDTYKSGSLIEQKGFHSYSFISSEDGSLITGFSPDIYSVESAAQGALIDDFVLYRYRLGDDKIFLGPFVNYDKKTYLASDASHIWKPESQSQVDYLTAQAPLSTALINTNLLRDASQIVPVPSETNASNSFSGSVLSQAPVSLEIPIGQTDTNRFTLPNGKYYFSDVATKDIPVVETNTAQGKQSLSNYLNKVILNENKEYKFVSGPSVTDLLPLQVSSFIKQPSKLQVNDWLNSYSDKTIKITQRTAEQSNFVSALTQRYNYFYEAATNILKAFTNIWSTISSNI